MASAVLPRIGIPIPDIGIPIPLVHHRISRISVTLPRVLSGLTPGGRPRRLTGCRSFLGKTTIPMILKRRCWSVVHREVFEGFAAVGGGGHDVAADVVEGGVAEHVGDDDEVGAAADEAGGEGVA